VSSGAVACGMSLLRFDSRPRDLSTLQAAAAVGQHLLMAEYNRYCAAHGLRCAQVLLTWDDFSSRTRYINARNTLLRLLALGVVPVINENDAIAVDEIKFGDNDRLSAMVSGLISADILIILSDVDGLLDGEKKVIPVIEKITPHIRGFACPTSKKTCVGGMVTKIDAAKIAVDSGILCVIANGRKKDSIISVVKAPGAYGSVFLPAKALKERQRWIAFGSKPHGTLTVDEGAQSALRAGKSLLAVGVTGIKGTFSRGDVVSIADDAGREFARGQCTVSARECQQVKGTRHQRELVHRDNIVLL
jgi:glutamate 5-kinase